MSRRTKILLVLSLLSCGLAGYAAAAAGTFKNLQVLPKTITKPELKAIMKAQSKALGVDCDFCHDMDDMALDTKHKKEGREMMRMTSLINSKFLKGSGSQVSCATCHRGQKKPEILAP